MDFSFDVSATIVARKVALSTWCDISRSLEQGGWGFKAFWRDAAPAPNALELSRPDALWQESPSIYNTH
jgi:hypothetical protein